MMLRAHVMSVPAPAILFPPTPSLSSFTPFRFLLSLLLVACPRLVPYSLVSTIPSLPCSRLGNVDVDDDSARTSALGSRQSGGRPTRGVVLQSATSRCTCQSLALTPDGLRASPALPTCSLVRRAQRPPPAYFPAPSSPSCRIQCCQPVNRVNEYNLCFSYLHVLMERESWGLDSNSFEHVPCHVSSIGVLWTASGTISHSSSVYFGPFLNRAKVVMPALTLSSSSFHERWATDRYK
jgi:hypothetical protein